MRTLGEDVLDMTYRLMDNPMMTPTPEETVREYMKASKTFRKQVREEPEKVKEFMLKIGLWERCASSPNGVRWAKAFR